MDSTSDINLNGRADASAALRFVRQSVDDYLEGTLDAEASGLVEMYAQRYPECDREIRLAKRVKASFASLGEPSCPESVVQSVLTKTSESTRRQIVTPVRKPNVLRATKWWQPALAVAATTVVAIVLLVRPAPQPEYTDAEISQAIQEVKWTLAYLNGVGKRTGETIRNDVIADHVVAPINQTLTATFD